MFPRSEQLVQVLGPVLAEVRVLELTKAQVMLAISAYYPLWCRLNISSDRR